MKTILFVLTTFLITLTACQPSIPTPEPPPYTDAPTQFIVKEIRQLDGMKNLTTYYVEVIDVNDVVHDSHNGNINLKFWFCDTIGKYKLGQPIHFDINR